MTTGAMQRAWLLGLLIVAALPKHVECGYPTEPGACKVHQGRDLCTYSEVEPLVFYGLEEIFHRNIGFAYASDTDCR